MKNASRFIGCASLGVFLLSVSGCAMLPRADTPEPDAVTEALRRIEDAGASDARYLNVRGREYLAFDQDLKTKLEDYASLKGIEPKQLFVLGVIDSAKALGDRAVELELKRVPGASEGELPAAYRRDAAVRLEAEKRRVEAMMSETELDRYVTELKSRTESSIKTKGRTARQLLLLPLSPFVNMWMAMHILSAPREAAAVNFAEAELYQPPPAGDSGDPARLSDAALLERYAPVIAMEKKDRTKYDPASDRFGNVVMEGKTAAKAQPRIDVKDPVVYGYTETKSIRGTPVKMLVYTLWFPERPSINGGFDPEVGSTQGSIIRIALDSGNRPLVYENVSSCGCYYKIFPTERFEERAHAQFGSPLEGKRFASENRVPGKIDAAVPSLVKSPPADGRVIAFYSAGTHEVMDIRPELPAGTRGREAGGYRLLPYETLESLPFNGGTISMFDKEGLVRNADRLEATLLAASGMYHPGTPRQRGTLMIYFDQADFDDPNLLPTYLRSPDDAFRNGS